MVCDTSASKDVSISKFGIPISNNIRDMFWTRLFYKLGQRSRSKANRPQNGMWHSANKSCIHTPNLGFLPLIIQQIWSGHNFLKTRPEVKVTVSHKWYKTLHHPKMHSHTKIGIPISNNIRDMLLTQLLKLGQRSRSLWPKNGKWHSPIPWCIYTPNLESYLKEYKRYVHHTIILKTRSEVKVTVTWNGMWHSVISGYI